MKLKKLIAAAAIAPIALSLAACSPSESSGDASGSKDSKTVTIGIVDINPQQDVLKEVAKEKGINIVYKPFQTYTQPNPALKQKQIDLNWFQHIAYLADYNVNANDTLTPIGPTEIVPLGLYSKKHTSVKDLPQGAEVAIPNDSINEARALNLLKAQGLVTLTSETTAPSTLDVDKAKSKVKVTPVDATQTVLQLSSLDAAVVNNTFLGRANLDPNKALAKDDPKDPSAVPYVNGFVSRAEDKDNETYKQIAELYHDSRVQEAVKKESKGTSVEAKNSQAEMIDVLKKYEDSLKNAKK
ncbi:MetQ/NlpA family ABC transporter substrate-binding protein [Falsarthrobacter nasiphocae]|uniref:D-methionine transport system substrate-binding protein n=1 Tax=Falsarthrobacter nasiphocae TaxID=189863 RepID=A0AAE3YGR2_9MICC|nr:MetQ/NlpA family ABC transporter substrate-binding protein [Falsarthrobacter nasiphocae]MDR6891957.1 D-methionine transport system substrate-binding protein [Falsarthrobacter nasiphocae]